MEIKREHTDILYELNSLEIKSEEIEDFICTEYWPFYSMWKVWGKISFDFSKVAGITSIKL